MRAARTACTAAGTCNQIQSVQEIARRLKCTLAEELSRRGVVRHVDATRHNAGDTL
jgi:hypothetical protein